MEPVRPMLTNFVVDLFLSGKLGKAHFLDDKKLNKEGLSVVLEQYHTITQRCVEELYSSISKIFNMEKGDEACSV